MALSTGGDRYMSRQEVMLKQRALFTAKNPSESKFGTTLLKNNAQEHRILDAEMMKIEGQLRRKQMHLKQEVKQFLRKHVLPDPIIIVQRPPSPELLQKHGRTYGGEFPGEDDLPHYMKPIESKRKPVSLKATIDAFRVKPKKKYNVWEEVTIEKQKPQFRSIVNPTWPLSETEMEDLQKGLEYHQPYRPRTTATGTPVETAAEDRLPALTGSKPSTRERSAPEATPLLALPTPPSAYEGRRMRRRRLAEDERATDSSTFLTEVDPQLMTSSHVDPHENQRHEALHSLEAKHKGGKRVRKKVDKSNKQTKEKKQVVIHAPSEDDGNNVATRSSPPDETLVATTISTVPSRDQHVSAHVVISHYQCTPGESEPNHSEGSASDFDPNRRPSGLAVILEALDENDNRR